VDLNYCRTVGGGRWIRDYLKRNWSLTLRSIAGLKRTALAAWQAWS